MGYGSPDGSSTGGSGMGPLDFLPVVGMGVDYLQGQSNAKAARRAFKSRYQDTVADMKKAGLNPALAYGQGGGNPQTHDQPMVGEELMKGVGTVNAAKQARANADLTNAQAEFYKASAADRLDAIKIRNAEMFTHTTAMGASAGLTMLQQDALQETMRGLRLDNDFKEASLSDRVEMVRKELLKKGIDIDYLRIQKALGELALPQARAEARFYEGAGQFQPYVNSALDIIKGLMPRFTIQGDRTYSPTYNMPRGK